jgi:hypothetical protein
MDQTQSYLQYSDLASALRYYSGLRISGTGRNTRIYLTRNEGGNNKLRYIINGIDFGTEYNQVNDCIIMPQVRSIRVIKGLASSSLIGQYNSGGTIEITTF